MASAEDIITEGLTTYVEKTHDNEAVRVGALLYKSVSGVYDDLVRSNDVCRIAFPTMVIRPNIRTDAFAAVLADRVIIAWRKGVFKRRTEHVVIETSRIDKADWYSNDRPPAVGASFFEIVAGEMATIFALPMDQPERTADLVKQALSSPVGPEAR